MIPRFDYSYSLGEAWQALHGLIIRRPAPSPNYTSLFGLSSVYEVAKARTGIVYALKALQLRPNAKIGVQPYTCSSVMAAIVAAGCCPIFIDINQSLTLDEVDLNRKVDRLDALIVTHSFGLSADINLIKQLAGHLPIIEDCAHAFMSTYQQAPVGSFFDMAVFSFGYGKFPVLGSGGLIVVNNPRYNQAVLEQVTSLQAPGTFNEIQFIGQRYLFSLLHSRLVFGLIHPILSWLRTNRKVATYQDSEKRPFRSAQFQLDPSLKKQFVLVQKQQQHVKLIGHGIKSCNTPMHNVTSGGNGFAFVILSDERDRLYDYLIQEGIGAGKHFEYAESWAQAFGYVPGDCPAFEQLVGKVLTVPSYHTLTQRDINRINKTLQAYYRTFGSLQRTENKHPA
jgi:dTDP-4-amino-4,6-dideoxygalactose transaminase